MEKSGPQCPIVHTVDKFEFSYKTTISPKFTKLLKEASFNSSIDIITIAA
jgi:hypothetical protein